MQYHKSNWINSGSKNASAINNPRFLFNISQQGVVEVSLTAAVNIYLFLLNDLGQIVAQNGDFEVFYNYLNPQNSQIALDLLPVSSQVVAGTNTTSQGEIGNFLIDILFPDGSSQTFSDAWTYAGGKSPFSFNNPRFTFNVADTSFVTINIRLSQATELYLLG